MPPTAAHLVDYVIPDGLWLMELSLPIRYKFREFLIVC